MRGTGYAIAEIAWWMLAAAGVGFLIGWFVRRWFVESSAAAEWEPRVAAEKEQAAHLRHELEERSDLAGRTETDLAATRTELERAHAEREALAAELAEVRTELERAAAPSAQTETPVAAPDATAGDGNEGGAVANGAGSGAEPAAPGLPDKETARAKLAQIAARTRGDEERVEDDLKMIRGVGPKLEQLLKSFDITSFRQVASFTPEDIAFVTAALDAFPGRIERDDWMSSAAEEHRKKYGTPVR